VEICRGVQRSKTNFWRLLDDVNGFLDVVVRLVDVFESALLETLGEGVVFFLGHIVVGFVDEFESPVETAAPIETCVNRRMIVDVLAVVDGGFLDFVDGLINFVDGMLFLVTQFTAVGTLQMSASVAEIGQCVKIRWMLSRRLRLCRSENNRRNNEQERGNNKQQLTKAFHRASGSYSSEINLQDRSGRGDQPNHVRLKVCELTACGRVLFTVPCACEPDNAVVGK
jgi:hypothetical protein